MTYSQLKWWIFNCDAWLTGTYMGHFVYGTFHCFDCVWNAALKLAYVINKGPIPFFVTAEHSITCQDYCISRELPVQFSQYLNFCVSINDINMQESESETSTLLVVGVLKSCWIYQFFSDQSGNQDRTRRESTWYFEISESTDDEKKPWINNCLALMYTLK